MKLTVSDLTKTFGRKTAVSHVNLELTPGVYGLLGPNGAGKTNLIRLLVDLLRPDQGAVLLDGKNISDMGEEYRMQLGYLPQKAGYYPWLSAEKFLLYMAALKGLDRADAAERTRTLLQTVGLYEERKKHLSAYSGGMLQRVEIAQALLNDPKILILDEPTTGLDPQERIRFRNMIRRFSGDRIILLSTHIVSDVEQEADQVILLREGHVVRTGTVQEISSSVAGKAVEDGTSPLENAYLRYCGQEAS